MIKLKRISNLIERFVLHVGEDPSVIILWIFAGLICSGYFVTLHWLESDPSFFYYFLMISIISIPPFFAYSIKFRKILPKKNSKEVRKAKIMLAALLTFMVTSGFIDLNFLMAEGAAKLPGVTLTNGYAFWHEFGMRYLSIVPIINFLGLCLSVRAIKMMNIPSPAFPIMSRSYSKQ